MRIRMVKTISFFLVGWISGIAVASAAETSRVISDFGAVGNGTTLNTLVIQKVIDQLAKDGGGTVVVPAGRFLTGSIFFKAGVNLRLETNGVLLGSTNIDDYPSLPTRIEGHMQVWRPALLNAVKCDRFMISGEGRIEGGGKPFWDAFWKRLKEDPKARNLDVDRPRNIFIQDSKAVVVSGVSLRDSGFWNLHLYRCQNVRIEKLDIRTPPGAPSTDGIDIDSCQDVTVSDCYLSVDDDDIALKGSKGPLADQDTESPAVQSIHVFDCTFGHGHGAVTLGSEACHVKDVLVENCKMEDAPEAAGAAHQNVLVRLKLRPDTPQHYEDIHFRNITIQSRGDLVSIEPWTQYFDLKGVAAPAQLVENITLENITGSAGGFGRITGPKNSILRKITFKNVNVTLKHSQIEIENVEGLKIENSMINGQPMSAGK